LVDTESSVLSDVEFVQVLNVFTNWALPDHQQSFAVGEYYSLSDSLIAKVLKTSEGMCAIRVYSPTEDKFWDDHMAYRSLWGETRKPATAEQIATFKKAEYFSSKGRKLNEFDYGDKVYVPAVASGIIKSIDKGSVFIIELADGTEVHFDGSRYEELALLKTDEELQEVGDGKDRENKTD